jgi:tetratricopeptide (TPR) repeat protein
LAYANFVGGNLETAKAQYQTMVTDPDLGWEAQEPWILAHYQLGSIHQQQGNVAQALEYYHRFLEIWQDGDDDLVALVDARRRVAELSGTR